MKITDDFRLQFNWQKPWYYGFAYHAYDRNESYYYWIPFNLLVRKARIFWRWMQYPATKRMRDETAYQLGYHAGFKQGVKTGKVYGISEENERVLTNYQKLKEKHNVK